MDHYDLGLYTKVSGESVLATSLESSYSKKIHGTV